MEVTKDFLIAFDIYQMRYKIGAKWFETFDVLKDYLIKQGHKVEYRKQTLIFNGIDMSKVVPATPSKPKTKND